MASPSPLSKQAAEIDKEYSDFTARLEVLKKEQADLIKEYRKKLELKKIQRLREQLTEN